MAKLWRAFIPYSHYDGIAAWPYPGSDRDSAGARLKRLAKRPQFICHEVTGSRLNLAATRRWLKSTGLTENITFAETGFRNHNDAWLLRPSAPVVSCASGWRVFCHKSAEPNLAKRGLRPGAGRLHFRTASRRYKNGMDPKENLSRDDFPDELREQFAVVERRLWKVETTMAVCLAAPVCSARTSSCFSPTGFGTARAGSGRAVGQRHRHDGWRDLWWTSRWVFHRRDTRALARLVQRRYRRLGDRLLGIVELADEEKRPAYFRPPSIEPPSGRWPARR